MRPWRGRTVSFRLVIDGPWLEGVVVGSTRKTFSVEMKRRTIFTGEWQVYRRRTVRTVNRKVIEAMNRR